MKSFLKIVITLILSAFIQVFGQSGYSTDLKVYDESYVFGKVTDPNGETEYNVNMRLDLYDNQGNIVQPQSSFIYNWWRRSPNLSDSTWYSWTTNTGFNTQSTHTYINNSDS